MCNFDDCKIEYYGRNVFPQGHIYDKVYYYYSSDAHIFFPKLMAAHLKSFDICKRDASISYSYFINDASQALIYDIASYINSAYCLAINVNSFCRTFSALAHFNEGIHYDPILSLKMRNEYVYECAFYINTLKNKTFNFWQNICTLFLDINRDISSCIEHMLTIPQTKVFLFSFDWTKEGLKQNKIYLKSLHMNQLLSCVGMNFPNLFIQGITKDKCNLDNVALAIRNNKLDHINLYFKPNTI